MAESAEKIYEDAFPVEGGNFDNAGKVSTRIKSILKQKGLPGDVVRRVALVSYESEINIVSYARKGVIRLTVNREFIIVEAIDEGQGIPDIEKAMQPGWSTASDRIREMGFGAGMGLCNIKNYSDVFNINTVVGEGTSLRMQINMKLNT